MIKFIVGGRKNHLKIFKENKKWSKRWKEYVFGKVRWCLASESAQKGVYGMGSGPDNLMPYWLSYKTTRPRVQTNNLSQTETLKISHNFVVIASWLRRGASIFFSKGERKTKKNCFGRHDISVSTFNSTPGLPVSQFCTFNGILINLLPQSRLHFFFFFLLYI